MSQDKEYFSTTDLARELGVTPPTIRAWIAAGLISAERPVPMASPGKRNVSRYKIAGNTIHAFNRELLWMNSALRKYIPREKNRMRRQAQAAKGQQRLPGMDAEG